MTALRRLTTLLSSLLFWLPVASEARDATSWPVKGRLVGKGDSKSKDISGIACSSSSGFPRQCVVIDDNAQSAQSVTLRNGWLEAGTTVPLISDSYQGRPLELDGEGVAYADGTFYVIGSHGHPRDAKQRLDPVADRDLIAARIKAASQIVRLTVAADGTLARLDPAMSLTDAIAAQPDLRPFAGQRLERNGVTIEGVAVKGDRIFAGFRGPVLPGGRAAILSVSLAGLTGSGPLDGRLFKLPLGEGQGVRDLASYKDGILVLAGPVGDEAGRAVIHRWDGASDDGCRSLLDITELARTDEQRKAEAFLPLDEEGGQLRLLVFFDGPKEGAPMVIYVPLP